MKVVFRSECDCCYCFCAVRRAVMFLGSTCLCHCCWLCCMPATNWEMPSWEWEPPPYVVTQNCSFLAQFERYLSCEEHCCSGLRSFLVSFNCHLNDWWGLTSGLLFAKLGQVMCVQAWVCSACCCFCISGRASWVIGFVDCLIKLSHEVFITTHFPYWSHSLFFSSCQSLCACASC